MGQKEIPVCLGLLLQASLKGAWALFSGAPALSCFENASVEDPVRVGRVCWCCLAISVNSPMLPFAHTH